MPASAFPTPVLSGSGDAGVISAPIYNSGHPEAATKLIMKFFYEQNIHSFYFVVL